MKILNRWTLSIIFENEKETIKETVVDANLSDTDLSDADLSDADLIGAVGNKKELRTMQIETYSISFTKDVLQIGCKRFLIEDWKIFNDEEINNMDNQALSFWNKWKDFIFQAIELSFGK